MGVGVGVGILGLGLGLGRLRTARRMYERTCHVAYVEKRTARPG